MAYDYDVDILAALWTGAEALEEPYLSFIAANPDLTDEVSENRILSTIELLRSHMELLETRGEAKLLHESISKLFRHTAGGSNPWSEAAAITNAVGNVPGPTFPAGASIDITIDGVTSSPASASGGDCATVAAELNATLDAGIPGDFEQTTVDTTGATSPGLSGTSFNMSSASDVTDYYVWFNFPGVAEAMSLDFTTITGATLPTGAVAAAYFDIDSTTAGYRCWFDDSTTIAPVAGGRTLVAIPFTGADTDIVIAGAVGGLLVITDADFVGFLGAPVITGTLASVGNVTDPVDGAVTTGAIFASTTQGVAASTDPATGGRTGIPIAVAAGLADSEIGSLVRAGVGANPDFSAEGVGNSSTLNAVSTGDTTDSADVDSGLGVSTTNQGVDDTGDAVAVQAFCEFPGPRLGIRGQTDFVTFDLANGSGGIVGPAGIIPGERSSKPKQVADQGRDLALGNFGGRSNPNLTS